jgi:hypothetical protein
MGLTIISSPNFNCIASKNPKPEISIADAGISILQSELQFTNP